MLLSAGLALPREVWAHGYVQWEGTKMSKSAGTAVSLDEAIERHGPDALRYFLLREVGFEADGNFTWDRFDERYTADLADGLGNLASRSLAMLAKYRDGVVPTDGTDTTLDEPAGNASRATRAAMDALDLRGGAEAAWELVVRGQPVHPADRALGPGQGRQGRRSSTWCWRPWRARSIAWPCWRPRSCPGKAQVLWRALGLAGSRTPSVGDRSARRPRPRPVPANPRCSSPSRPVSRS